MIGNKTLLLRAGTSLLLVLATVSAAVALTPSHEKKAPSLEADGRPGAHVSSISDGKRIARGPSLARRSRSKPGPATVLLGGCQNGAPDACDDGIACTEDSCDPVKGCLHAALDSSCDDDNICTTDTCDPGAGCVYSLNGGIPCSDNNACTGFDSCPLFGAVVSGDQVVPPVSTGMTGEASISAGPSRSRLTYILSVQGVDPADITGADLHIGLYGTNGPVIFQIPVASFSSPVSGVLTADDLVPQPKYGVVTFDDALDRILAGFSYVEIHTRLPGEEIRGQIPFGYVDAGGTSSACVGTPINCDDANACSEDACDPASGCTHIDSCDDGNPCTDDACDPASGCQHVPNSEACDDGDVCTPGDVCSEGECHGKLEDVKTSCDDGNSCTSDFCDPDFGCFHMRLRCNDFNAGTLDSCVPGTGCVHTPR